MPRAPALNIFDPNDLSVARKHAAKWTEPAAVKAGLTMDQCGFVLVHNKDQNGFYTFMIDGAGLPVGVSSQVEVVFALVAETSEVICLNWKLFSQWVQACVVNPQAAEGGMYAIPNQSWTQVGITRSWGETSGVISSVIKAGSGDSAFLSVRAKARAVSEDFVHLHAHSMYSLLDGASSVEAMAKMAAENGQRAMALTDHGAMYGSYKFFLACKDVGIKPILGVEAYMIDDVGQRFVTTKGVTSRFEYHQTVLAMNREGWENLCEILSDSYRSDQFYVPRVAMSTLLKRNQGLFVLSGCFKGPVAWHLQKHDDVLASEYPWCRYDPDRSRQVMQAFKDAYGDRYAVECQRITDFNRYNEAIPRVQDMAASVGVPTVASNDCHYEKEEDAMLQALMSRIGKDNAGDGVGAKLQKKGCLFIKSRSEMEGAPFTADMLDRTCEIAERCTLDLSTKGHLFPSYDLESDEDWTDFQVSHPVVST